MDNGLYALSPPDHTLRLPALATAFPFTSCCPSSLFLHLPCPALDCLNSQTHFCRHLYAPLSVCLAITPFPPPPLLPCPTALIYHLFCLSPFSFAPSIHPYFSAVCLSAPFPRCCALVRLSAPLWNMTI